MSKLELHLLRGLPGSGKSTLAKSMGLVHLEADQFFTNKKGEYRFDGALLSSAHQWCQLQCEYYLYHGQSVVVANTFIKLWEMKAYKKIAKKYNATLKIQECKGNFTNVHDVPASVIVRMKQDFER